MGQRLPGLVYYYYYYHYYYLLRGESLGSPQLQALAPPPAPEQGWRSQACP